MSSKPLPVIFSPHNLQLSSSNSSTPRNTSSTSSLSSSPRPREAVKQLASPIASSPFEGSNNTIIPTTSNIAAGNGISATRRLTATERLEKSASVYKADGFLSPQPISDPNLQPKGYPLDDILTPLERSCKEYLMNAISKDMIECVSLLAVERPVDPHLWLAHEILKRGKEGSNYIIVRRTLDPRRDKADIAKDLVVKEGGIGSGSNMTRELEETISRMEKVIPKR